MPSTSNLGLALVPAARDPATEFRPKIDCKPTEFPNMVDGAIEVGDRFLEFFDVQFYRAYDDGKPPAVHEPRFAWIEPATHRPEPKVDLVTAPPPPGAAWWMRQEMAPLRRVQHLPKLVDGLKVVIDVQQASIPQIVCLISTLRVQMQGSVSRLEEQLRADLAEGFTKLKFRGTHAQRIEEQEMAVDALLMMNLRRIFEIQEMLRGLLQILEAAGDAAPPSLRAKTQEAIDESVELTADLPRTVKQCQVWRKEFLGRPAADAEDADAEPAEDADAEPAEDADAADDEPEVSGDDSEPEVLGDDSEPEDDDSEPEVW